MRNILLPYEYESNCISRGHNVLKQKNEFSQDQRRRLDFINRLTYAEDKDFCICIEVFKIYEGE